MSKKTNIGKQLELCLHNVSGRCYDAIRHNQKVKNNYGPQKFIVIHDGGIQSKWSAFNRSHLDRLLRIQKNMEYMIKIEGVQNLNTFR